MTTASTTDQLLSLLPKVTLEQAQQDLSQTDRDIEYLTAIVTNLREFVRNDKGRESYRRDLMRYERVLDDGKRLRAKISTVVAALTPCVAPLPVGELVIDQKYDGVSFVPAKTADYIEPGPVS